LYVLYNVFVGVTSVKILTIEILSIVRNY